MKYVYILVSSPEDYLPEQTFVAMYSLKRHNPDAEITLITDSKTFDTLEGNRGRLKEFVSEFITTPLSEALTPVQKNRYLETTMRRAVSGDFIYIDNDTVVVDSLKELENLNHEVGAVLNLHKEVDITTPSKLKSYIETTGKEFWGYTKYFNSGVLLVRDTPRAHALFDAWHRIWSSDRERFGVSIDQPSLAQADVENNRVIEEIDGIYNCQLTVAAAHKYMFGAKIVHYFASSPSSTLFPLTRNETLKEIRDKGITPGLEEVITLPQATYLKSCVIQRGVQLNETPFTILSKKIEKKFPFVNSIARAVYRLGGNKI